MRTKTARTSPRPRHGPSLGVRGREGLSWPLLRLSHGDMGPSLTSQG